ncbi:MAG: deoxyribodipyrimidine photo-lyase [Rhodoferax sp.]|nr:deoxyribodipyrimidine photo-lyase [Rhodoferax sp.]
MNTDTNFASGLMWFRRDLRTSDNATLQWALRSCRRLYCVFVFDRDLLDPLPRRDRRVEFIRESLVELDASLRQLSGAAQAGLTVRHGVARGEIVQLAAHLGVQAVFAGRDDEPQALARDQHVATALKAIGMVFETCKDHVIFERREILTQSGTVYGVFTPYKNNWLARVGCAQLQTHELSGLTDRLAGSTEATGVPTLQAIGFQASNLAQLNIPTGMSGAQRLLDDFLQRIDHYDSTRDFPALKGPSHLGVHLRFGTVSVRRLVALALQRRGSAGAAVWLSELVWRDFYMAILANFPHVAERAFKPEYDAIGWDSGPAAQALFTAWCQGQTGYPLVDAAMAQLNQTGYMHNRLRMVVGSFLVKDLGLDWRWGERNFAKQLNDFKLASNNGGWQWVASSGCDAQPYFRIFNPVSQSKKFDPDGKFIRRYLPQLAGLSNKSLHAPWLAKPLELQAAGIELGLHYPLPVVLHERARTRTLLRYAVVKKSARPNAAQAADATPR